MPKTRRFLSQPAKRNKLSKAMKKSRRLKRAMKCNEGASSSIVEAESSISVVSEIVAENSNSPVCTTLQETTTTIENFDFDNDSSSLDDLYIEKDLSPPKTIDELLNCRRIVNLGHILKQYESIALHGINCTMGKMVFVKEIRQGLFSQLHFSCDNCNKTKIITTDPNASEVINENIVWGSFSVGIGHSQLEEMLSLVDVPVMTQKSYHKYSLSLNKTWESHLIEKLNIAGQEEKRIALEKGHVTSEGIPYITVIGDGGWSKRTYGHGYNAASGVGILIGAETKKPLFVGVRNKICAMCAFYASKQEEPKPHKCFLNYSGPSTGMEKDILIEGFCGSIEQHGLIYKYYIGDGDSSVYSNILTKVPYGRHVIKIECANHMTRCMNDKLHKLSKNTSFDIADRRILTDRTKGITRIERLVKGVRVAIKSVAESHDVEKLRKMISNAPYHVFGQHSMCCNSYCTRKCDEETNFIPQLEKNKLLFEIKKILDPMLLKADRLAFNETTNSAERFMGLVAKFVGGKRVNFTKRSSYATRAYGAALSHFAGPSWHKSPLKKLRAKSTGETFLKVMTRKENISCKRKLTFNAQRPKKKKRSCNDGPDQDYGLQCTEPDLDQQKFEEKKNIFLLALQENVSSVEKQSEIANNTKDQHGSSLWREIRKERLTASNFGCVVKRRPKTHCHNLVKRLLYSKELNTAAINYGRVNEQTAIIRYESLKNVQVEKCGIFLDVNHPYLGASPDGLLPDEGLIEVKCFPSLSGQLFKDVTKKTVCFTFDNGQTRLKRSHNYYYQIQGQLNITGRTYCDLVMYMDTDFSVERIFKDSQFWKNDMLPKLKNFYIESMLPELIDPRIPRGLKIRDYTNDSNNIEDSNLE